MRDYHAKQLTGSACQGRNCACASGAMGLFFATRGGKQLTADQFRRATGKSCVPGVSTPSGGITINDVERVFRANGVKIDYRGGTPYLKRWTVSQGQVKLSSAYGAVFLGDYDQLPWPWRASTTFRGDHSVWVHDYRVDKGDSHYGRIGPTVCWHDPLRGKPIRIPWLAAVKYWQKVGSPVRGFAGFVRIPLPSGASYATPFLDRTRTRNASTNVHSTRTSSASTVTRRITPKGRLVQLSMYAKGEPYGSGPYRYMWGAPSMLGNEWVHLNRLDNVKGST